jgi:hypothetical protein
MTRLLQRGARAAREQLANDPVLPTAWKLPEWYSSHRATRRGRDTFANDLVVGNLTFITKDARAPQRVMGACSFELPQYRTETPVSVSGQSVPFAWYRYFFSPCAKRRWMQWFTCRECHLQVSQQKHSEVRGSSLSRFVKVGRSHILSSGRNSIALANKFNFESELIPFIERAATTPTWSKEPTCQHFPRLPRCVAQTWQ